MDTYNLVDRIRESGDASLMISSGLHYTDRVIDHLWYDRDETTGMTFDDYAPEDTAHLAEKEAKRKAQQRKPGVPAFIGALSKQKNLDNSMWELKCLHQSGVRSRSSQIELNQLIESNIDNNDAKKMVLVRNVLPPFISSYHAGSTFEESEIYNIISRDNALNEIYSKFLTHTTNVIKDPTSDIAQMAKKGSFILHTIKEDTERASTRNRFWELEGSKLGELLNLKEDALSDEDDEKEKVNSTFAKLIESGETPDAESMQRIQAQRMTLPVFKCREELVDLISKFQILIVVGETGSGKTTQLCQFLYESGYTKGGSGIIGCTQPRRVAAVSVAQRVAVEMGVKLGELVGYTIRFEDCTSTSTVIKYMTDGILLRETLVDPDLERYSCIIMDEAHERSLNTDVLFGILRSLASRRSDIRIIITSATMDSDKFSAFFGNAPVFKVPGRTYHVQIEYLRVMGFDYIEMAVKKCIEIHLSDPGKGDILIFMTGQDDINATCQLLSDRLYKVHTISAKSDEHIDPFYVFPIYSQLPSELQAKVFKRYKYRKVIVATNIAETSLTFEDIKYVIDTGFCKLKVYNTRIGMDSLQVAPVSQASANQRSGRAGRTGPGTCYRLYTERTYISDMFPASVPEIMRTNLCNVVLLLKSLKVDNLFEFDFMDPPSKESILSAMLQLWVLGALDPMGDMTEVGNEMVQFPLDPPLSKMLIQSIHLGCVKEMLTIVSMISAPNIFHTTKESAQEETTTVDAAREKFYVPESDHLTLLNVYNQWAANKYSPAWCRQFFIQLKSIKRAYEVRCQLLDIIKQRGIEEKSCINDWDTVRKAICSGYFHNAAKLKGIGEYSNLRSFAPCHLHPSSALYGMGYTPDYVVYHEVVITTKEYMRNVTAVDAEWLSELGSMFFYLKSADVSTRIQQDIDKAETLRQITEFTKKRKERIEHKTQSNRPREETSCFGRRKRRF